MRTRVCILLAAVAAGLTFWCTAPGTAGTSDALPRVTLELKDISLEGALRLLFHGTPYTFKIDPGLNTRVTIAPSDATWDQALRALVRTNDLSYAKSGNVYHISSRTSGGRTSGSEEPSLSEEAPPKPQTRDSVPSPPGYAVIYQRETDAGTKDIVWQGLTSRQPRRLVYTHWAGRYPPESRGRYWFGFLPSPDGRWLYVWELTHPSTGWAPETRLFVVRLPQGELIPVSQVQGASRPLPRWVDNSTLLLETDTGSTTFDVHLRKLAKPLPRWSADSSEHETERRPWLAAYCDRQYPGAVRSLRSALQNLGPSLGIADHLKEHPEPPEMMLLRGLGIADLGGIHEEDELLYPSVACSPKGDWLARAGMSRTGPVKKQDAEGQWRAVQGLEARIDLFNLARREGVWSTSMVWPGYDVPEGTPIPTYSPHWVEQRFGDLRSSTDGRFLSYTAYDLTRPAGVPLVARDRHESQATIEYQGDGRERDRPPQTAVVVLDLAPYRSWNGPYIDPGWTYFYITDVENAFVIPVWDDSQLWPPGAPLGE